MEYLNASQNKYLEVKISRAGESDLQLYNSYIVYVC